MSKTTTCEETCNFGFVIKFDMFGYYIHVDCSSGQHMHNGHPKPMTSELVAMPMQLMTDEMKSDAQHAMNAQSRKAAGSIYLFGKFGKYINSIKIAYLTSTKKDRNSCDIAKMLETFQASDEISFTCLSDIPVDDFIENNDLMTPPPGEKTITVSLSRTENHEIVRENV